MSYCYTWAHSLTHKHTHTHTHIHSVGFLCTRDRLVAETSTWQHTTLTRDIYLWAGGIRTRNPSKGADADPSLRPWGHWDRTLIFTINYFTLHSFGLTERTVSVECQVLLSMLTATTKNAIMVWRTKFMYLVAFTGGRLSIMFCVSVVSLALA